MLNNFKIYFLKPPLKTNNHLQSKLAKINTNNSILNDSWTLLTSSSSSNYKYHINICLTQFALLMRLGERSRSMRNDHRLSVINKDTYASGKFIFPSFMIFPIKTTQFMVSLALFAEILRAFSHALIKFVSLTPCFTFAR